MERAKPEGPAELHPLGPAALVGAAWVSHDAGHDLFLDSDEISAELILGRKGQSRHERCCG